ncbi:unnamed protein product [Spodoptera exigua]|nr:unnamed protein product [Spodoptera exigua]
MYTMNRRRLSDRCIEDYLAALENGYISEDDEDMGDEDDIAYYPDLADLQRDLEDGEDEATAGADLSEDEASAVPFPSELEVPPLIETSVHFYRQPYMRVATNQILCKCGRDCFGTNGSARPE